jgi:uncharacterized protein (TIRG00374 family)
VSLLSRSNQWKLWLGLLISTLFIYLAFRKVDLARMWAVIGSADTFSLTLVVGILVFQFVLRAWRWEILLEPIKRTGFFSRLSSIFVGFAGNCIFPARLGEFIRANYLGHTERISASSSFGTIVVERLFDGFTLLLFLLVGLLGTSFAEQWQDFAASLRASGFLLLGFYILVVVFLVGFKFKAKPFLNLLDRFLFFLPGSLRSKTVDTLWNFSLGLVLFRNPWRWVQAIFYSLLLWFSYLFQIQLIEQSIGLTVPFMAGFLILAISSLGVMIPSAPGFIGTFHLAVTWGFLFYGIDKEEALSAAILWHAAMVFPTILFGLVSFMLLQRVSVPLNVLKRETLP